MTDKLTFHTTSHGEEISEWLVSQNIEAIVEHQSDPDIGFTFDSSGRITGCENVEATIFTLTNDKDAVLLKLFWSDHIKNGLPDFGNI